MRPGLTAAIALVLALGVAACGEKEEPEPGPPVGGTTVGGEGGQGADEGGEPSGGGAGERSPEQEVERAVEVVLGGGDPEAACSDLVTDRYVRTAYGDEQGCRAAVEKQGKFAVAVTAVDIRAAVASAKAKPARGPNKGETITVKLEDERGTWRVDSAVSNAPAGP
jgi:hypothetical protein